MFCGMSHCLDGTGNSAENWSATNDNKGIERAGKEMCLCFTPQPLQTSADLLSMYGQLSESEQSREQLQQSLQAIDDSHQGHQDHIQLESLQERLRQAEQEIARLKSISQKRVSSEHLSLHEKRCSSMCMHAACILIWMCLVFEQHVRNNYFRPAGTCT